MQFLLLVYTEEELQDKLPAQEFDIEMMDADLPRLKTLGDLTDYVVERMAA